MGITIALCLVDSHVPISFEPLLLISMWLLLQLIAIVINFLFCLISYDIVYAHLVITLNATVCCSQPCLSQCSSSCIDAKRIQEYMSNCNEVNNMVARWHPIGFGSVIILFSVAIGSLMFLRQSCMLDVVLSLS